MKKEVLTVEEYLQKQQLMGKEILNPAELCTYTGFSKSYLYKLTHRREIPFYCPQGKLIFFKRSEIELWLLKNKRKSKSEIETESQNYLATKKNKK
ncbi:MAG TPA: DNA-binding protein [Ignavibacteriales bacterium]|nr:DNA-binding protein [Ignavibacteriales bacterium]